MSGHGAFGDSPDPAAEALYGDAAELRTPVIVLVPDIRERCMAVSFAVDERVPFMRIVSDDQKIVQFAEFGQFMRNRVNAANRIGKNMVSVIPNGGRRQGSSALLARSISF